MYKLGFRFIFSPRQKLMKTCAVHYSDPCRCYVNDEQSIDLYRFYACRVQNLDFLRLAIIIANVFHCSTIKHIAMTTKLAHVLFARLLNFVLGNKKKNIYILLCWHSS